MQPWSNNAEAVLTSLPDAPRDGRSRAKARKVKSTALRGKSTTSSRSTSETFTRSASRLKRASLPGRSKSPWSGPLGRAGGAAHAAESHHGQGAQMDYTVGVAPPSKTPTASVHLSPLAVGAEGPASTGRRRRAAHLGRVRPQPSSRTRPASDLPRHVLARGVTDAEPHLNAARRQRDGRCPSEPPVGSRDKGRPRWRGGSPRQCGSAVADWPDAGSGVDRARGLVSAAATGTRLEVMARTWCSRAGRARPGWRPAPVAASRPASR